MSATVIDTIDVGEAAYLLRQELGPLKQWTAWLSDCARGKAGGIHGLTLKRRIVSSRPTLSLSSRMP